MAADDPGIEELLNSVAGGQPVDWDRAVTRASARGDHSRIASLRDVARVAEFHRVLQRDQAVPGAGPRELERWGDLLLLERVGSGASGEVYRAWDPALQREVALKLLRPGDGDGGGDGEAWLEEARSLARVRDPHVVMVHGAAVHEGRSGLWMEYLHGPTLAAELTRRGPLPPAEVARLAVQLGHALTAVHATGALHRDVKPANVIFERDGRAVLADFGLGRRGLPAAAPGAHAGTPMFMSPQRLAGATARETDDVYALGVTLWFALTGRPPFVAATVPELRCALQAGRAPSLLAARPDAPPELARAIERAMAPEPGARFDSARSLGRAFESTAAGTDSTSPRVARVTRLVPWLAVGLAVAAVVVWFASSRVQRRPVVLPLAPSPDAASPAYDVSAGFLRRGVHGDDRLQSGDRVAPGDLLSLEFRASRPAWVYVLDADERGETYLLFPQPLFDRQNPLPADTTLVLPGARSGRESAWTVTSRGGREHLLVVANPQPMAELEAELRHLPPPTPGQPVNYARVRPATMERLRGVGGVSDAPRRPTSARPAEVLARIRVLAAAEHEVRGPWMRQIVLENPR